MAARPVVGTEDSGEQQPSTRKKQAPKIRRHRSRGGGNTSDSCETAIQPDQLRLRDSGIGYRNLQSPVAFDPNIVPDSANGSN
jgi:hypothetical protein